MNVSFGLIAILFGWALAVVGVKGRGKDVGAPGSDVYNNISLGATLVKLLRGTWPYDVQLVPGFGGYPGTLVGPPGNQWIIPINPNEPGMKVVPPASYTGPPPSQGTNV